MYHFQKIVIYRSVIFGENRFTVFEWQGNNTVRLDILPFFTDQQIVYGQKIYGADAFNIIDVIGIFNMFADQMLQALLLKVLDTLLAQPHT